MAVKLKWDCPRCEAEAPRKGRDTGREVGEVDGAIEFECTTCKTKFQVEKKEAKKYGG